MWIFKGSGEGSTPGKTFAVARASKNPFNNDFEAARWGGERSSRPTPCCGRTSFFPSSDYESTSKQAKAAIDRQNDSDSRSSDSAALPMS